jgi:chemotaxis regulatin CheY-phosphate phosphatase CheZ
MTTTYKWFESYSTAVLETDWSKIEDRIGAVEAEIKERLREFSLNHGGSPEENRAIVDALDRLKSLRADVTSWRESNRKP